MHSLLTALIFSACVSSQGFFHWWWNRSPEVNVTQYEVWIAYKDPNWYPCTFWACGPFCDPTAPGCCVQLSGQCIAYNLSAWSTPQIEPQRPIAEPSVCTEWDSGIRAGPLTPPLGSVLFINVRARNSSGQIGN